MNTKNTYKNPFEEKLNIQPAPAPAHTGPFENAIDYPMQENTPVLAARDGTVIRVKDDSTIGGPDESLRDDSNLIQIQHEHEEYSVYAHLKPQGAIVKDGEKVKEGQVIGYSGMTGFTTYPHLHFHVFQYTEEEPGWKTLKIRFK